MKVITGSGGYCFEYKDMEVKYSACTVLVRCLQDY